MSNIEANPMRAAFLEALRATQLPAEGVFGMFSWDLIDDSLFQYRKHPSEKGLVELEDSIKTTGGIHTPLLCRRRFPLGRTVAYDPADGVELVDGQRRKISGMRAMLSGGPVLVKDLEDEEVRIIMITSNLQREDVHAIEEAEGFDALMTAAGMSIRQLAAQFAKSPSYVAGRLKLLQACPEIREACLQGDIIPDVALLVARLGDQARQVKALEYIKKERWQYDLGDGGKASFRKIRAMLNEKFTLNISSAYFDPEDATLVVAAGTCSACPKRTGNALEFEDVAKANQEEDESKGIFTGWLSHEGADVCTDPDCFDTKKQAHHKRRAAALAAEGKIVVDGNKARAAVSAQGEVKGAYLALKDVKSLLKGCKQTVPTVTVLDPRTDKEFEAVRQSDLAAAGVKPPAKKASSAHSWHEDQRRRDELRKIEEPKAEREMLARRTVFYAIREAVLRTERTLDDTRAVAQFALSGCGWNSMGSLMKLWGCNSEGDLRKAINAMTGTELMQFMLDCTVISTTRCQWDSWKKVPPELSAAAQRFGIDLEGVRAKAHAGEELPDLEELLSTPLPAARAGGEAAAKAKIKSKATGAKKAARATTAAPAQEVQSDDAGSAGEEQTDEAGCAGQEVKDKPADAGDRDPNTSDMFGEAAQ